MFDFGSPGRAKEPLAGVLLALKLEAVAMLIAVGRSGGGADPAA